MANVNSNENGSSLAVELPNKSADNEIKAARNAEKELSNREAELNRTVASLNITDEEKEHTKNALRGQSYGNGGKLPSSGDIEATVGKVTGRVGDLPPEVLAAAAKIGQELQKGGTGHHPSDHLAVVVAKQPQQEQGLSA